MMKRKLHLITLLAMGILGAIEASAQNKKERRTVIITNGDTTIRDKHPHILYWDDKWGADSLTRGFNFRIEGLDTLHSGMFERNFRQFFPREPGSFRAPGNEDRLFFPSPGLKKNSAQFTYQYVDKDGIEENINISLSDATTDQLHKITGNKGESSKLEVKEITIFPDFNAGGLNLTFRTTTSGSTRIRLLDSNFKDLFTDSDIMGNSAYLKSIPITRNGIYYLAISQAGQWYVKRIIRQ